jgi:hypothetical protein
MKNKISFALSCLVVISMVFLARSWVSVIPKSDPVQEDIYNVFLEGQRILTGVNPYARILEGNMRINQKYPTYFPLYYEASYLTQKLGFTDFDSWLRVWLKIYKGFYFLVALLLYAALAAKRKWWQGTAAAGFWLFNRWTLYVITTSNFDFLPIFFMLAAFILYPKQKWLAVFLLSVSLGLKQIAIFVAPLFVVWVYLEEKNHWKGIKQALMAAVVIASVPLISSIPFLAWNLEGFVRSIAFSATRFPGTHTNLAVNSLDALLGWEGLAARIPMGLLLLAVYWFAYWDAAKRRYLQGVFIFVIFVSFNAVLFNQYFTWLISLVPLLVGDIRAALPVQQKPVGPPAVH